VDDKWVIRESVPGAREREWKGGKEAKKGKNRNTGKLVPYKKSDVLSIGGGAYEVIRKEEVWVSPQ